MHVPGLGDVPEHALRGRVDVLSTYVWPAEAARTAALLFHQPDAHGEEAVRLEYASAGYRMRIAGLAEFVLAPDGTEVQCRPELDAAWRWQRVLAGQALPMAALLQGIEVLHAGAVAFDVAGSRVAVGVAAGSHGGKSSLAIALTLRGARLITDDALAVELAADGTILAHPGIGAGTLRRSEVERLQATGEFARLQVLGEAADSVRVLLEREQMPCPLAAIYWPERSRSISRPEFVRMEPDPRRLLAGTINVVLRDPARLRRHFEVSTAIAARVPSFSVGVPASVGAGELAAAIEDHARGSAS